MPPSRVERTRIPPPSHPDPAAPDSSDLLQEQIRRLEEQFSRLREQVRQTQQLAALGTAAAMMAHEYNNMMTPVVGYAKYALDADDSDLMRKALEVTLRQASVLSAMSDRILGLAANEAQQVEPVQVKAVIEEAIAALCRDPSKDGLSINVLMEDELRVLGDDKQLQQVFFNLILNAWQAIEHRNGRITLAAEAGDNGHITVSVSDNGNGIRPEILENIFDPFFTTKGGEGKNRRGSGLGLALCREIIDEHHGSIDVDSTVGEGTTFRIRLPKA